MRVTGGKLGNCSSGRNTHLGRSTEKSNSSYTGTGFPLYGHYGRGK